MSSELVFYLMAAARKPVATIDMTYDCAAALGQKCVLLTVRFEDGKTVQGIGCTIFGALHGLMAEGRKLPDYFSEWKALN